MARVTVWNATLDDSEVPGDWEGDPCPGCRGRGDDDCLTCGGEGYV